MSNRGSRAGWMIDDFGPGAGCVVGGSERGRLEGTGPKSKQDQQSSRPDLHGSSVNAADDAEAIPAGPLRLSDPRLSSLRLAADSWRRSAGPRRRGRRPGLPGARRARLSRSDRPLGRAALLPDPDRRTRLDIAVPACVSSRAGGAFRGAGQAGGAGRLSADSSTRPAGGDAVVVAGTRGRGAGLVGPAESDADAPGRRSAARGLGATPPGLVLADPEAPMLAGAVALAAGHFQPLVRLRAPADYSAISGKARHASTFWRRAFPGGGVAIRANGRGPCCLGGPSLRPAWRRL